MAGAEHRPLGTPVGGAEAEALRLAAAIAGLDAVALVVLDDRGAAVRLLAPRSRGPRVRRRGRG